MSTQQPQTNLQFVAGEYSATGEGITWWVLITRAYPKDTDYSVMPDFNFTTGEYFPGELTHTSAQIALSEFEEIFGEFASQMAEVWTEESFLQYFGHLVPDAVRNMLKSKSGDFQWYSQFHFNLS